MARAQGARAQMALAFGMTYGTPPASGYTRLPFASTMLGAEQPLLNSELLGYGRDPLPPVKDAVTADGDVVVPIDARAIGFWLQAAFGTPTTIEDDGVFTHSFQSGSWTLPSMAIETAMPEAPRFAQAAAIQPLVGWRDDYDRHAPTGDERHKAIAGHEIIEAESFLQELAGKPPGRVDRWVFQLGEGVEVRLANAKGRRNLFSDRQPLANAIAFSRVGIVLWLGNLRDHCWGDQVALKRK